jgi:hypothetical protein
VFINFPSILHEIESHLLHRINSFQRVSIIIFHSKNIMRNIIKDQRGLTHETCIFNRALVQQVGSLTQTILFCTIGRKIVWYLRFTFSQNSKVMKILYSQIWACCWSPVTPFCFTDLVIHFQHSTMYYDRSQQTCNCTILTSVFDITIDSEIMVLATSGRRDGHFWSASLIRQNQTW